MGAGSPGNQQGSPLLGGRVGTGLPQTGMGMQGLQQPNMGMGPQQPVARMGQPQPVMGMGLQPAMSQPNADPLAVLNDLFVSLDSIQPGKNNNELKILKL